MRGWKYLSVLTCILLISILGLSCKPETKVEKVSPKLEIPKLSLANVSPTAATVEAKVKVENPNPAGATLDRIAYDIYFQEDMEWHHLGKADRGEDISIKANDSTTFNIENKIELAGAIRALYQFLSQQGSVNLKVSGSAWLKVGPASFEVPFEQVQTVSYSLTEKELKLAVMVPKDGTATLQDEKSVEFTVGSQGIPVVGATRADAVVTVDDSSVKVKENGMFIHPVGLTKGPNMIEITASDLLGNQRTISMVVYRVSPEGIPLYISWPADDSIVNSNSVPVIGATSVDAVVTVNGAPVEVDELGIFSKSVELEEGPNVIEVTASDLQGNIQSQRLVVFRAK